MNLPHRDLPHTLDRTVVIQAAPQTVFSFFTDNDRWASWWGAGSTIDPKTGGRVYIRHANGIESSGRWSRSSHRRGWSSPTASTAVIPSRQEAHASPSAWCSRGPPRGSICAMSSLMPVPATSTCRVGAISSPCLAMWSRISSTPARSIPSTPGSAPGRTRAKKDGGRRSRRSLTRDVRFRDRFSLLDGRDDLVLHIGATQRFMPGLQLRRQGEVRHCQGTLLVDWVAVGTDGSQRGAGTNVFVLQADGKVDSVTGFWS